MESYTQMADFGDFDFLIVLKVIRKYGFLKSDFLIDLKSYILRKSDFLTDLNLQAHPLIPRPQNGRAE